MLRSAHCSGAARQPPVTAGVGSERPGGRSGLPGPWLSWVQPIHHGCLQRAKHHGSSVSRAAFAIVPLPESFLCAAPRSPRSRLPLIHSPQPQGAGLSCGPFAQVRRRRCACPRSQGACAMESGFQFGSEGARDQHLNALPIPGMDPGVQGPYRYNW